MARVYFLFLVLWTVAQGVQSQIIKNSPPNTLHSDNYFNERFIRENEIVEITGKVSIKRDLEPITDIGTIVKYRFNENGKLVEKIETINLRQQRQDTSSIMYQYDDINQLIAKTTPNSQAYNAVTYKLDSAGRIVEEQYLRGKNLSQYKYQFEKGKNYTVKSEVFAYEHIPPNTLKKIHFNNEGTPYQQTLFQYDSLNNLRKQTTRFVVTNRKIETDYQYTNSGQLSKIVKRSNLSGKDTTELFYQYDELSNLHAEITRKNGNLVQKREFLYNPETALLKAELTKQERTGNIKIIQFEYRFAGEEETNKQEINEGQQQ